MKVRESASFSGIPITERLDLDNRICGVSLVDLRSGQEVGFVTGDPIGRQVAKISPGSTPPEA